MRLPVPEQSAETALAAMRAAAARKLVLWGKPPPRPQPEPPAAKAAVARMPPPPRDLLPPVRAAARPSLAPTTLGIPPGESVLTCVAIIEAAAALYWPDRPVREVMLGLKSPRRAAGLASARQVIMHLCARWTLASSPAIGKLLNREHATVLWGNRCIERRLEAGDAQIAADIAAIAAKLGMVP